LLQGNTGLRNGLCTANKTALPKRPATVERSKWCCDRSIVAAAMP